MGVGGQQHRLVSAAVPMEESASMLWARVVRGISSTENAVTPACATSSTTCFEPKGRRKPTQYLIAAIERQILLGR
jgi:hypothetical protein